MRCIRCGREIPNNARICRCCGTPQPVNRQQLQRYPVNRPNQPQSPGKKPRPVLFALLIVFSIILLFGITAGIIVLVGSSFGKHHTKHETQETSGPETHSSEPESEKTEVGAEQSFASIDEEICASVSSIIAPYVDENYYFEADEDVLTEAALRVYDWAKEMKQEGRFTEAEYCEDGYSVSFTFPDGSIGAYVPQIKDYYTGNEDIFITVFDQLTQEELIFDSKFYQDPGITIKSKIPTAESRTYDISMTVDDLRSFVSSLDDNPVRAIFWRGHGGKVIINNKPVIFFATKDTVTEEKNTRYRNSGDLAPSEEDEDREVTVLRTYNNNCSYGVTYRFFDKYMPSVNGGLFFITACWGNDDDGSMANTFLDKGFDAYVGGNTKMNTYYGNAMISDTANYLAEKDEDGVYTDIKTALEKAAQENNTNFHHLFNDSWGCGGRYELVYTHLFRLIEDPSFYITFTSSDQSVTFDKISIKCLKIDRDGTSHPYDRVDADELADGHLRIFELKDEEQIQLDISYEGTLLKSVTYEYDAEGENREEVDLRKAWLDFEILDKDEKNFDDAAVSVWGVPGASGTNGLIQDAEQSRNANGQRVYRIPVEPGKYNYRIDVPDGYNASPSKGTVSVTEDTTITIYIESSDVKHIYAEYIREKLLPESGMADLSDKVQVVNYNNQTEFRDWDSRTGLMGAEVVDLDGDGTFECLVYSLKENPDSERAENGENALYVTVLTMDSEQNIIEAADELLTVCNDNLLVYSLLGTIQLDGKTMLYMEHYTNAYFADGDFFTYDFYTFENGKFYRRYRIFKSDGGSDEIAFSLLRCSEDGSYDQEYLYGDGSFTYYSSNPPVYSSDPEEGIRHGFDLLGIPQSSEYMEATIGDNHIWYPLVSYAHMPETVTPSVMYLCSGHRYGENFDSDWEIHIKGEDYTGLSEWLEDDK